VRTLIATLFVALLAVASPASAEDGLPVPALTVPAGYTGPAIYGLWPKTGNVATVLVYAPVDRRWGVERVARQWNEAGGLRLVLTSTPCQGCITIRKATSPDALADAAIYADGGVMQRCDIRLDPSTFFPQWAVGRRSVVAHELGHCLGLGHTTRSNSAVGKMSGLDGPTWRDLEWIQQLYGTPTS